MFLRQNLLFINLTQINLTFKNYFSRFFLTLLTLLLAQVANSQIVSPFNPRYQINQKGGIKILSNVSVSCGSSQGCINAQNQVPPTTGGTSQNGGFTQSYVDIDGTIGNSTFSSSSDSLTLPNCSEILWAGLYWSARINAATPNYGSRSQAKVKIGNGAYQTFTADQTLDVPIC